MINDWFDIFKEQVEIMKEGLFSRTSVINVGCLGSEEQKKILEKYLEKSEKLRLASYSPNLNEYEFHTLRYLKEVVNRSPNFYGFYVHTKGVSWPNHEGGKYWRDYMNHYVLREWRENIRMLDLGYDTCGVKLINKRWPLHYSGNFFWFKGDYVKGLVEVNKMNLKDRFNAEMWVCSGEPIAATLCQDFVDYNTKGVFKPKKDLLEETKEHLEFYTKYLLSEGYCDSYVLEAPTAVDQYLMKIRNKKK